MVPSAMPLILEFLLGYVVFVFSTTCHEAAHALVARRGGDDTAYSLGHVTLDPTPHIMRSPFGMIVVPLATFYFNHYILGWASVPYDPQWSARHPLRAALMSLAGPFTNFLLSALGILSLRLLVEAGVFHLGGAGEQVGFVQLGEGLSVGSPLGALGYMLTELFRMNLLLGIFNLVPLPPLDGAGVAEGLSPRTMGGLYARLREIPASILLNWFVASWVFQKVAPPVFFLALRVLG